MTATVIPSSHLTTLRRQRGLLEYRPRHCLRCSRVFRSAGDHNRVCQHCRSAAGSIHSRHGR